MRLKEVEDKLPSSIVCNQAQLSSFVGSDPEFQVLVPIVRAVFLSIHF